MRGIYLIWIKNDIHIKWMFDNQFGATILSNDDQIYCKKNTANSEECNS